MEYLNNLLNSNTQSGGVYAVSMHQLNQILQLSSAYFNRFDDNTKQQYIKLFGFTPLSLLKGHSSSKMPQYRERFIFLIYLQFCVLLMMNNTAGMKTKEEVLEYLDKLCTEFKIDNKNPICSKIKDSLKHSSASSTASSTTPTDSSTTPPTDSSTPPGPTSPDNTPVVPSTSSITLYELIRKIYNYNSQTGGNHVSIDDFNKKVVDEFINDKLYENFINLIIYDIDDLNEDIEKIATDEFLNDDIKNVQIIKLILNFLSDESGINIYYDDDKKEFIVLNFDENNVEKINNIIKNNSLNILNEHLDNDDINETIKFLIQENKLKIENNKFNYYDFYNLIKQILESKKELSDSKSGGSYNNIDITNTLQDIF